VKLGLIAGGGDFPLRIAQAAAASGHDVFVVCIRDFCDPAIFAGFKLMTERLGAGGAIVRRLKAEDITHLVLAGRAARPSLLSLWPDPWMARALAKVGTSAFAGDDALLRVVVKLLEDEGFAIISPQEVLADSIAEAGLLAGPEPDCIAKSDIARGVEALRHIGPLDIGQAIVVQQGLVLGVEAIEGTDALVRRAGRLARSGVGGVLVKIAKPGQELRVDAPVIGPQTIVSARMAGLRGIAIEARRTLLTEKTATLAEAECSGIFIIAI